MANSECVINVAHRLGLHSVLSSVLAYPEHFEIVCLEHRQYKTWKASLSSCHVVAMHIRNFNHNMDEFWTTLARSVAFDDNGDIFASTQHIATLPVMHTSALNEGYLVHQATKQVLGEQWEINFISEIAEPFYLEIRTRTNEEYTYVYRIHPKYLVEVFAKHCRIASITMDGQHKSQLFKVLVDGLIFSDTLNTVVIKQAERAKLVEFAGEYIGIQETRAIKNTYSELEVEKTIRQLVKESLAGPVAGAEAEGGVGKGAEKGAGLQRKELSAADVVIAPRELTKKKFPLAIAKDKSGQHVAVAAGALDGEEGERAPRDGEDKGVGAEVKLAGVAPTDEVESYFIVREAINIKAERRSQVTQQSIVSLFLATSLGPHLKECSQSDLLLLASSAHLQEAVEDVEVLTAQGDPINNCFIVLKGIVLIDSSHGRASVEAVARNPLVSPSSSLSKRQGAPVVDSASRIEKFVHGDVIGLDVLRGLYVWDSSISIRKDDPVCFCVLPAAILLRCVGQRSAAAAQYMKSFWRYTRLWNTLVGDTERLRRSNEIAESMMSNKLSGVDELFEAANKPTGSTLVLDGQEAGGLAAVADSGSGAAPLPAPETAISACNSAHLRVMQAGDEIFKQGAPRHFMFVVVQGECSVLRRVPFSCTRLFGDDPRKLPTGDTSIDDDMNATKELDIGLKLLAGDFSFVDGEPPSWAKNFHESSFEEAAMGQSTDGDRAVANLTARGVRRNKQPFGAHKHTLLAMTRVEVCVVPLREIARSPRVPTLLLIMAGKKYRRMCWTDEMITHHFIEEKIWTQNRLHVLQEVLEKRPPTAAQKELNWRTKKVNSLRETFRLERETVKKQTRRASSAHTQRPRKSSMSQGGMPTLSATPDVPSDYEAKTLPELLLGDGARSQPTSHSIDVQEKVEIPTAPVAENQHQQDHEISSHSHNAPPMSTLTGVAHRSNPSPSPSHVATPPRIPRPSTAKSSTRTVRFSS